MRPCIFPHGQAVNGAQQLLAGIAAKVTRKTEQLSADLKLASEAVDAVFRDMNKHPFELYVVSFMLFICCAFCLIWPVLIFFFFVVVFVALSSGAFGNIVTFFLCVCVCVCVCRCSFMKASWLDRVIIG